YRQHDVDNDAFVDGGRVDARAAHGFGEGHRAEDGCAVVLERPQKLAAGKAGGTDDDGAQHVGSPWTGRSPSLQFDLEAAHRGAAEQRAQAFENYRARPFDFTFPRVT